MKELFHDRVRGALNVVLILEDEHACVFRSREHGVGDICRGVDAQTRAVAVPIGPVVGQGDFEALSALSSLIGILFYG